MITAVLAFDIGGTWLRVALVSPDGRVLARTAVGTRGLSAPDLVVAAARAAAALCAAHPGHVLHPHAGAAVAAMLDGAGDIRLAPGLGYQDAAFAGPLAAALAPLGVRRVVAMNDLDAAALGESWVGAAAGVDDVMAVFVGTGVGAGLVLRGAPYTGADHVAAEIGHVKIPGGTRVCGCGQVGCLEAYVGGKNLDARVAEAIAAGIAEGLVPHAPTGESPSAVTLSDVDRAAAAGPGYADALWTDVSSQLGCAIANAVTLLNPAAVILGGGVLTRCPTLVARTVSVVQAMTNAPARDVLTIDMAALADDAGLIGSAAGAMRQPV